VRILLLNQYYRPDVAATGQLLADVAERLALNGHEVHVICSRRSYGGGERRLPAEEEMRGVRVHRVAAAGFGRRRLAGRLVDYGSFYLLAGLRAIRLPRMHACLALTTPPFIGLVGALLARLRGTVLVLWSMDLYPEVLVALGKLRAGSLPHRLLARVGRWLYRRTTGIISLGEVMSRRLVQAGADRRKIVEVHNWVPGEMVEPIAREQSYFRKAWGLGDSVTLMYSGNLGLGHELDTALKAISQLDSTADFRAVFVGDGVMRPALERLAADLGLGNVVFRPPQPLHQLSGSLAAGDIHLVAQRPGTQGILVPSKLYGVMAAARPVVFVGPEGSEAAHIVRDSGGGVVVQPGNADSLAAALTALIHDAELRAAMGWSGRRHYERHFGRDRSVAAIVNLVHHCTNGGPDESGT